LNAEVPFALVRLLIRLQVSKQNLYIADASHSPSIGKEIEKIDSFCGSGSDIAISLRLGPSAEA